MKFLAKCLIVFDSLLIVFSSCVNLLSECSMFRIQVRRLLPSKLRTPREPIIEVERESQGSLVERNVPPEWLQYADERASMHESGSLVRVPSTPSFVPSSVNGWAKIMDREAGDDERDYSRVGLSGVVPDTKLLKYEMVSSRNGGIIAIKTASPECMIAILQDMSASMKINVDVVLAIMSRTEYLSTTLSVKRIRLLLEALASVPSVSTQIESKQIKSVVRALGNEILCRFHSLTLFSCASILSSLASLNCREPGTLNLLCMAFEKLCDPSANDSSTISDKRVLQHVLTIMRAFKELDYSAKAVYDTGLKAFRDRQSVADLNDLIGLLRVICLEEEDASSHDWLDGALVDNLKDASAGQLIELVGILRMYEFPVLKDALAAEIRRRLQSRGGKVVLLDKQVEDDEGLPVRVYFDLDAGRVEKLSGFLGQDINIQNS